MESDHAAVGVDVEWKMKIKILKTDERGKLSEKGS